MTFALLADEFHSDPKTVKATLAGAGLYARALSYCAHYLTDGFVPFAWAAEIAKPAVRRSVLEAGLWVEVAGGEVFEYVDGDESYTVTVPGKGFFIPDFLAFNPAREHVLRKRSELSAKRSAAGKKGAAKRWQRTRQTSSKPSSKPVANGWPPSPTPIEPRAVALDVGDGPGFEQLERLAVLATKEMR